MTEWFVAAGLRILAQGWKPVLVIALVVGALLFATPWMPQKLQDWVGLNDFWLWIVFLFACAGLFVLSLPPCWRGLLGLRDRREERERRRETIESLNSSEMELLRDLFLAGLRGVEIQSESGSVATARSLARLGLARYKGRRVVHAGAVIELFVIEAKTALYLRTHVYQDGL